MRRQSKVLGATTLLSATLLICGGGPDTRGGAAPARDVTFTRITQGSIVEDRASSQGCAWGDYDGDGFPDLLVSNFNGAHFLYHNNGGRDFSRALASPLTMINDGWLDLFVADIGENNFLYRNNGDGTFTKASSGSVVNDRGSSQGCAWGDYDRDGFQDLFVANTGGKGNFLFHNDGNANNWITVKCAGAASNRSGIGAKVRVRAVIGGSLLWQTREISGGGAYSGQNGLVAAFGLGDAPVADAVRIEWPSGIIQELHDISSKQFLTVIEPSHLQMLSTTNGLPGLLVTGGTGWRYRIERSTDLGNWSVAATVTNAGRRLYWTDAGATNSPRSFYRAVGYPD